MNGRILIVIFIFIVLDLPVFGDEIINKDEMRNFTASMQRNGILPATNYQINNNATLNINYAPISNPVDDWFTAAILRGNGADIDFSGDGQLNLFFDGSKITGKQFGVFVYRNSAQSKITFDVNSSFKVADNSVLGRGFFLENGVTSGLPPGAFIFRKNFIIDVNNAAPTAQKLRNIFYSETGGGNFFVNTDFDTHQIIDPNNIVQLKGDIRVGGDTALYVNMANADSFWMGRLFDLDHMANSHILLSNGAKWYVTYDSEVSELSMSNPTIDEGTSLDAMSEKNYSIVDLFKYASSDVSGPYCPNDNCPRPFSPFSPRILKIKSLNGQNGIFRLMADINAGKVDRIDVGTLNAQEYVQIYQDPSKITLDGSGKNMVVAQAGSVADGADFKGLKTSIGLYDYMPNLQKTSGGLTTQWILASIEQTPNQTAKSLLNLLSLPYQIFRIEGDSAHTRIDDLIYPPTLNGLWAKVYGGGIYEKQPYGEKTTQDLFYNIQGGYDKGEVFEEERYFYGGSMDYTKLRTSDGGMDGYSDSIGFGAYGGYINEKGWVLDSTFKYVYSHINADLFNAKEPLKFGNHMVLLSVRVGYNFYPFYKIKKRTIEKCIKGAFCRNALSNVKVRDESMYIQPYFSLTPALIFGNTLEFEDKLSHSNINAKLSFSPALISKIGLLGVKRYDYMYSALNLRALVEYSNDINLGGKVRLVDGMDMPLYNDAKILDNRLGLGIGADWMFFNDSLKLHMDFKSEFFGHINTYWLLSAGIRYKFGQKPTKTYKSLNLRPMPPRPQKVAPKVYLRPYEEKQKPKDKTFYQENHFKTYGDDTREIMQKKQQKQEERQKEKQAEERRKTHPVKVWQSTRPMPRPAK